MGSEKLSSLKNLYIGPEAGKRIDKIWECVGSGKWFPGLYIITFSSNDYDQLDIISSLFLKKKYVREHLPCIAGYAMGRQEAYETVAAIARDSYLKTGKCDLQGYLLSIQGDD